MHAITINENIGHEFEGEWAGVYGRIWKEKGGKEKCNYIISKVTVSKNRVNPSLH